MRFFGVHKFSIYKVYGGKRKTRKYPLLQFQPKRKKITFRNRLRLLFFICIVPRKPFSKFFRSTIYIYTKPRHFSWYKLKVKKVKKWKRKTKTPLRAKGNAGFSRLAIRVNGSPARDRIAKQHLRDRAALSLIPVICILNPFYFTLLTWTI